MTSLFQVTWPLELGIYLSPTAQYRLHMPTYLQPTPQQQFHPSMSKWLIYRLNKHGRNTDPCATRIPFVKFSERPSEHQKALIFINLIATHDSNRQQKSNVFSLHFVQF